MVNAFGPGLVGPTPDITVTGELVDEADPFDVVVTGSVEAPHLHFKVPGVPGPQGGPGPWQLFDDSVTRDQGDLIVWDATAGRFKPAGPLSAQALPRVMRYTQPESAFTAYSGSNASQLISTMALPALDWAYQVDVSGHVRVGQNVLSSAQVAIVVRLGDPTTGPIVAKGLAITNGPCIIDATTARRRPDNPGTRPPRTARSAAPRRQPRPPCTSPRSASPAQDRGTPTPLTLSCGPR